MPFLTGDTDPQQVLSSQFRGASWRSATIRPSVHPGVAKSVRDAIAVTTLWADASEADGWGDVLPFVRERLAEHGENLVTAQAHLLVQTLKTLRDVINGMPEDVDVMGVDRPVTVLRLLEQLGADAARFE